MSSTIRTIGNNNYNDTYISVEDIEKNFELNNFSNIILEHKEDLDYKLLFTKTLNNTDDKELYVSYKSFIKYIFNLKTDIEKIKDLQNAMFQILFTHQLGTNEQKYNHIAYLLHMDIVSLKEMINKNATTMPYVYLFSLGKVKDLKNKLNLSDECNDDHLIIKYGIASDLKNYTSDYLNYIKSITTDLKILYKVMFDPQYASEIFLDVNSKIKEIGYMIKGHDLRSGFCSVKDNLYCIDEKKLPIIEKLYSNFTHQYIGHARELNEQIKKLKEKLTLTEELYKKEMELKKLKGK